jgi:hypothetical protein
MQQHCYGFLCSVTGNTCRTAFSAALHHDPSSGPLAPLMRKQAQVRRQGTAMPSLDQQGKPHDVLQVLAQPAAYSIVVTPLRPSIFK